MVTKLDRLARSLPDASDILSELDNLGTYSTAELAELFGVSRSTIYRTLQRI